MAKRTAVFPFASIPEMWRSIGPHPGDWRYPTTYYFVTNGITNGIPLAYHGTRMLLWVGTHAVVVHKDNFHPIVDEAPERVSTRTRPTRERVVNIDRYV